MIRNYSGTLAYDASQGDNIVDTALNNNGVQYTSVRSPGATHLSVIDLPDISSRWSLQSVSVNMDVTVVHAYPCYGRLGKLIASVIRRDDASVAGPVGLPPWQSPMLPLPADGSLSVTLFDPAVNEQPAATRTHWLDPADPGYNYLHLFGAIQLPQMVPFVPAEPILMGLWWTPALIGSPAPVWQWAIYTRRARYTILYDDGIL